MELRLKALWPTAFGKFHATSPIQLEDGLNMIMGDNEAGKSTLQAFIHGMFYGFKREGRSRVSRIPEFEQYRPWTGSEYRGIIVYEHEGRTYRIERSFDPDSVKIIDDDTGEDLTKTFTQDVRKEYNFAQKHLGLSAKEFRNTVWIRQLGNAQEPGLGAEIQGKLQDLLQGGTEDVSFAKALAVLGDERSRIKTPRSTKALLDQVTEKLEELDREAALAAAREAEVREWLVQLWNLDKLRQETREDLEKGQSELERVRLTFLQGILSRVTALDAEARRLEAEIENCSWAQDVPEGAEEAYRQASKEVDDLRNRFSETEAVLQDLSAKKASVQSKLLELSAVQSTGLDETSLASLYSRYLSSKATATKGERMANEARRELRMVEDEVAARDLISRDFSDEVIRQAEEHRETCLLAEREKGNLDIEVERARALVASSNPGGASGWLYSLALGVLGIAILLTLMGLPLSIPAFAVAIAVFAIGLVRQSKIAKIKREDQKALEEKEAQVQMQAARIEEAYKVASSYLASLGVSSVEQLRALAREAQSQRERLKAAKDRYEVAHRYWFEASQDLSLAEKELLSALRTAGCLRGNEPVSDGAVDLLKKRLSEVASLTREIERLALREAEVKAFLMDLDSRKTLAEAREEALLAEAGAQDRSEFLEKVKTKVQYDDLTRSQREITERCAAILAGRTVEDIQEEMEVLIEKGVRTEEGEAAHEKDYEEIRGDLDLKRDRLAKLNAEIAALEKGIRLRSAEGRPLAEILEDIDRLRVLEEELLFDKDSLDLAYTALDELSRSIRREFAPTLNRRVGAILGHITHGRYTDVKISADLEMSVVHPATSEVTPIDLLSGGTLDQCYLALRVAMAEIIAGNTEFPLFLDDSLVQYDDRRLEAALLTLSSLSDRHQVILFSCHDREELCAKKLGLRCNVLHI